MRNRRPVAASLLAVPALALAGCGSAAAGDVEEAAFTIVTSTNVYASVVGQIAGDVAEVVPVIDSAAQDPHDYEATARDRLAVQGADLAVVNGGGYDAFMDGLVEEAGVEHVITVVELNHDHPGGAEHDHGDEGAETESETDAAHEHGEADADHGHNHIEGFNEHVWYDPHTMAHLVDEVQAELTELLPDEASAIEDGADAMRADIEQLEARLAELAESNGGDAVFFTEPVGGYLAAAAGLDDVTTDGFAEAVEEGQDVAPATLLAALGAIEGGEVDVLVANAQTGGSETDRVIEAAESAGVPVVEFTESLPDGETYHGWMEGNVDALADALA